MFWGCIGLAVQENFYILVPTLGAQIVRRVYNSRWVFTDAAALH